MNDMYMFQKHAKGRYSWRSKKHKATDWDMKRKKKCLEQVKEVANMTICKLPLTKWLAWLEKNGVCFPVDRDARGMKTNHAYLPLDFLVRIFSFYGREMYVYI